PEHEQAASYIRQHFQQAGFTMMDAPIEGVGFPGINLLTHPVPGRIDLPLFIVAAHYDTIPGSPGADDNASGMAALLELARLIRPWLESAGLLTARLQFAAYDLEEYGL